MLPARKQGLHHSLPLQVHSLQRHPSTFVVCCTVVLVIDSIALQLSTLISYAGHHHHCATTEVRRCSTNSLLRYIQIYMYYCCLHSTAVVNSCIYGICSAHIQDFAFAATYKSCMQHLQMQELTDSTHNDVCNNLINCK